MKEILINLIPQEPNGWHFFAIFLLLIVLLNIREFISLIVYQIKDFIQVFKLLKDIKHDLYKSLYPHQHKNLSKSKYINYYNGHFHELKTWSECSCGKKPQGHWTITGLKVSQKEGVMHNEKK